MRLLFSVIYKCIRNEEYLDEECCAIKLHKSLFTHVREVDKETT